MKHDFKFLVSYTQDAVGDEFVTTIRVYHGYVASDPEKLWVGEELTNERPVAGEGERLIDLTQPRP